MQTFHIYPKNGKMFEAQMYDFKLNETGDDLILCDDSNKPSKEYYLPFENVAAIVPDNPRQETGDICFLVYMKEQSEPIKVYASTFEALPSTLVFKRHQKDVRGNPFNEYDLDGIYIAPSEVIAVLPADGLVSYRRRH
jgi:hypothetical protein